MQKQEKKNDNFYQRWKQRKQRNINYSDERKNIEDLITKIVVRFFVILTLILFAALVGFVIVESILVFQKFGFWNMLTGEKWAPTAKKPSFGIFSFITATFWICFFAMILAIPLSIFSSLFICEFLPKRIKKISLTFIELLSGIPSVIFGTFGLMVIGPIFIKLGADLKQNMMTASFILALMALPTIITLSVNALNGVASSYRYAALALGVDQTNTTFKIVLKAAGAKIIGAVIFGFGRVIGETMAVIMIAGGSIKKPGFDDGFIGFIFASVTTLAGIIGLEINEATNRLHISALYAIGFLLLITVTLINIIVLIIYKHHNQKIKHSSKTQYKQLKYTTLTIAERKAIIEKYEPKKEINTKIKTLLKWNIIQSQYHFIITKIKSFFIKNNQQYKEKALSAALITTKINQKVDKQHRKNLINSYFKITIMFLSWLITMALILWIIGDVIIQGLFKFNRQPGESIWNFKLSNFFSFTSNPKTNEGGHLSLITTTFLLVLTAMSIAMPIGIIVAIYLNEYANKNSHFANTIRFILTTLASTPSIIFGMFGLMLFVNLLDMPFSILTAGLTLTVVVLPVIIKAIEDALKVVPLDLREAALALGANKLTTILRVVLPNALSGIVTSMILTMGRIIGESAPVYLTLGTTLRAPTKGFLSSGRTLTTHILFLNKDSPFTNKINLMYETGLITLTLIFLLNFLAKYYAKNLSHSAGVKNRRCKIELLKSKIFGYKKKEIKKQEKLQ